MNRSTRIALIVSLVAPPAAAIDVLDQVYVQVEHVDVHRRMELNCADPYVLLTFEDADGDQVVMRSNIEKNVCPGSRVFDPYAFDFQCYEKEMDDRKLYFSVWDDDGNSSAADYMTSGSRDLPYQPSPPSPKYHIDKLDKRASIEMNVANPTDYICPEPSGDIPWYIERVFDLLCDVLPDFLCRKVSISVDVGGTTDPTDFTLVEEIPAGFTVSEFSFSVEPATAQVVAVGTPEEPLATRYEWEFTDVPVGTVVTVEYEVSHPSDPYGRLFQLYLDRSDGNGLLAVALPFDQVAFDGVVNDCNDNHTEDIDEIEGSMLTDENGDLVPDICEAPPFQVPALTRSGMAALIALMLVAGLWGARRMPGSATRRESLDSPEIDESS